MTLVGTGSWGEVPNIDNDSALIRVSDASDSTKSDVSDSVFTIEKTTDVVMVTPNGGEYWNAWDTEQIVYMRSANANAVALDYSLDGGESWVQFASNQSSGSYDWFIPNLPSDEALIRVRDQNVSCRVDESDALLSIVSEVEVEVPNGGEEYQAIVSPFTSTGIYLMDDGTMVTDGGRFFDSGGESGNYSNTNYTKYFWPSTASNELRMSFTRFHTYNGCDVVNIYDATTNQLRLSMAGNLTPELHTSPRVAQGRGLKVVFTQSTSSNCGGNGSRSSGWDANIESIEVDYDNAPHPITWDITGTSKEFDLDYSVNGGLTWKRIVSNYYTVTGEYDWPVPDEASEEALIRVTDSENGEVVDVSDAVFTILEAVPTVKLLSPNGGGGWYAGTSPTIRWETRFFDSPSVVLTYSLDGGLSWLDLASPLNTGEYVWLLPSTPSTEALVKVSDPTDTTLSDASDAVFTIFPHITVTSPNGGETLSGCGGKLITWSAGGTSGVYVVELSLDGGSTWSTLVDNDTGGNWSWGEVPNIDNDSALIRVSDASDSTKSDVSDSVFTIEKTTDVVMVTPNGGEYWNAWDTEQIVYMRSANANAVALDYSLDGGDSWVQFASNQSSGSYDWFIPNLPSAEALIRVRDQNVSCRVDESDALLSIVSEVEVEVPNGGEEYQAIVSPFTSTGIYLMDDGTMVTDGGRFFDSGGESGNYSNTNYTKYFWPSTASNELRMSFTRFHTYNGCDVVNIYDATTNQLRLSMAGNLTPELHTSPRVAQGRGLKVVFTQSTSSNCGGNGSRSSGWDANIESIEVDYDNAPHPITWDITGTSKEFDLDYSVNGGLTWKRIVSNYYTVTGEYDWPVPDEASEEALIRVTDSENGEVVDVSDAVFTILEAVPTVKLLSPNGGGGWYAGTSPTIRWETRFFDSPSVVLTYSLDGGLSWLDLASPLNTGEYVWLLPSTPSTEALVKVSDPTDTTLSDASDAVFTIFPHITVTSPNGGETLSGCGGKLITWSAGGTSGVYVVELSLDGGSTWSTLVDNDTGGNWSWGEVPNIDNDSALIRVSDASDSTKSDVSDSVFTIEKTTDVVMVTPNGGEYWNAWDTEQIVYMRSANANAVALDYSLDGGDSWVQFASNQSSGSYDWFIPNLPSAEALIRVRDQNVSCRVDESDALLSIVSEVEVEVPNGGEEYQAIVSPFTSTGIYLMDDGTMVTDGGRFFDSGGESGNYSNTNYTKYFWPSTASNELRMSFTRFHTYNGCDVVNIYDATTNQLRLSMAGNLTPELHTSPRVAQGRGLKVVFTQSTSSNCGGNGSRSSGWDANIESIEVDYDNAPHPITWDITGTSKEFDLDYSVNGGLTWKRIVSNYYTVTGEYDWPVPDEASEEALIRVTDSENGEVVDVSDAVFTILAGVSEITILQPNTADILYAGASYEVQWSSRFLGSQYVKMELSLDNGETWAEVEENVLNDGSFDWIVPDTYSTTCLLRLTDMGDDETYDVSDIIFTISPPIVMTTQNSLNSNYRSCTVANINWFAGGTSGAYDILLSLDDGQTWDFIEEGYQDAANFVSYSWYVPNEITLSARVRVLDSNDSEKSDEGDEAFQISPTISLTKFNYGGLFTIGDEYEVSWQDTLTSGQYNLDYSLNEGNSWTSIVENYENVENTYNWLIPNDPSQEVILRIEDATNECKSTQSTIPFTLTHFEPTIQVDYPNGFEQLTPSETITLTMVRSILKRTVQY